MVRPMTGNLSRVLLLTALLVAGSAFSEGESREKSFVPRSVTHALGCLAARHFARSAFDDLKLAPGKSAWIRYYVGTVPGTNPTPGEFYIAVYSDDGLHGWLLLSFRDEKGKFVAVRNAYRLTKQGARWIADEGNGGLGTYRAMGQFATKLEKSPRYRVKLAPRTEGCAAPDE